MYYLCTFFIPKLPDLLILNSQAIIYSDFCPDEYYLFIIYIFTIGGGRDSPSVRPNTSADGWTSVPSKTRGFAPTPVDASKFKIKVYNPLKAC